MSVTFEELAASNPDVGHSRKGWFQQLSRRVEDSDGLSSLLAIFDQAMISGTSFVTAVVIGRTCGAETLGVYSLIASALAMTLGVQEQLITAPYVVRHHRLQLRPARRLAGSVLIQQSLFVIVSLLLLMVATLTAGSKPTFDLLLILTLASPAILMRSFIREFVLAHWQVTNVVLLDAVVCGSQLVALAVMFGTQTTHLTLIFGVTGVACLLSTVVWLQHNKDRFAFDVRALRIDTIRNWMFGRWALATHLAGSSTPYVMPWLLFTFHGEAATGYLASCSVIVGIANILLSGMSDFLTPRAAAAYAKGGLAELQKVLRSMAILSGTAIGSVCLVAALFGETIIHRLYDGRFDGAGSLVTVLTLSVLMNALGNVAGNGLWAINRPRANFTADMVTLTCAIASAVLLVRPWGPTGAAYAVLISATAGAISRLAVYRAATRTNNAAV